MFKYTTLLLNLLVLSLSVCADQVHNEDFYQQHQLKNASKLPNSLNFLVLGDWGRNGHYDQIQVAEWMDVAMQKIDGDFVVTTGDNFYSNGVASVNDPYWRTSFEEIYHGPHLFEDWYATLGNHDYRGNWQAQIDYSKISRRWNMPAPYYAKKFTVGDDNDEVLLLFIDTNPLNPEYKDRPKYAATQQQNAGQQLTWLKNQLSASTAKWKIVIGHHPLYSSGKRYGKTAGIRAVLEPIFEQYKVTAYFAGHEHDLQHNQPKNTTVAHFVSGAGSEVRTVAQREFTRFAAAIPGFITVSVNSNSLLVQMISGEGKVIYHTEIMQELKLQ